MKILKAVKSWSEFLSGCWREARLLTFPTRNQVLLQLAVVLVLSATLVLILYIEDLTFLAFANFIKRLFS